MAPAQRYRYVHDYPFWKVKDGAALSAVAGRMLAVVREEKDLHSLLALQYYLCKMSGNKGFKMPEGKNAAAILNEMEAEAKKYHYEVEETVAHSFLVNDLSASQEMGNEQQYVEVQKIFDRMEAIGFEKFSDYSVEDILLNLNQFMWTLGDFEKAFQYLRVAERFIQPSDEGAYYYTQVLSYLQTYWKQKKDYAKSIAYARKILEFHEHFQTDDPDTRWWNRFWKGFASIDIAALLIEQGNFAESERYADKGYALSKAADPVIGAVPYQAEFDALQVLIPVKLKLHKLDEAGALLQRALFIKGILEPEGQLDYFKPMKLYQHLSRYHEIRGDAGAALHFTRLAQSLQDSLDRKSDARKLLQVQRRLDAEKYAEQLRLVENEKQFQMLIRNAVLIILFLVLLLAFGSFRRLQYKRRQKEAELEIAKNELDLLTQGFREKSLLVEKLRIENETLSSLGRHSEYLEQLSGATILTEADWTRFRSVFEKVHPGFIAAQKQRFPDLTNAETRLLVLEKLELSAQEMANMLGVNRNTINQTRLRLRKKTTL